VNIYAIVQTLARASDSSGIKWQLSAFVADFINFGFSKFRDKRKTEPPQSSRL
jgi:hypothetical protein